MPEPAGRRDVGPGMKILRAVLSVTLFTLFSSAASAASLEASDPGAGRVAFAPPVSRIEQPVFGDDRAANRAFLLDQLHDYAVAGDFPRNTDTPDSKQLYFLDPEGRPCAVAFLMIQSGYGDAVEDIARTNNAVKVTPHTRGAIAEWISRSGLTVQDVMKIQEPDGYTFAPPAEPVAPAIVRADRERIHKRLFRVERELRAAARARPVAGLSAS